jgi:spore maturation protein B
VKLILFLSNLMIPLVFFIIIGYGMQRKVDIFDTFVEGAKDGFKIVLKILPTLIGLMMAVGILRSSGFLDFMTTMMIPLTNKIGFPTPLVPIAIMRTISSSATTGLVLDLFKTYGPDSFIGRMASIMMGCTETVFYTLSIYFMSVNIKKTRYAIPGALFVSFVGIIASVIITYRLFPQ